MAQVWAPTIASRFLFLCLVNWHTKQTDYCVLLAKCHDTTSLGPNFASSF